MRGLESRISEEDHDSINVACCWIICSLVCCGDPSCPSTVSHDTSAIDASQDFDIIEVSPGTYNEYTTGNGNIVILRSTDGPSSTFIFGDVRFLNGAQQSRIQGFTVNGSIICQNSDAMIIDCVSTGAKSNGIVLENSATQFAIAPSVATKLAYWPPILLAHPLFLSSLIAPLNPIFKKGFMSINAIRF